MSQEATRAVPLVACLVGLLGLAACSMPLREVGKAPEGPVREKETSVSRAEKARREEERHARQDAAEAAAAPGEESTPELRARIGVTAAKRFHRATCADLEDVPPEGRVQFPTKWSALDADYSPCPRCSPQ